jgi:hypothetical protein
MTRQKTTTPTTHRPAFGLGSLIGIGAGIGLSVGILLGDLVAGIMYGTAGGVVIGSVLSMDWHRTDTASDPARPPSLGWLMGCLAFLSVSALGGGVALVGSPSGESLHIPLSVLRSSPFSDFLIPGLILGIVFGVGSFLVAQALLMRPVWPFATALTRFTGEHWVWSAAVAVGAGQIIWIVTETVMLRGPSWLGLIYGSLGALIVVLAFRPGVRRSFALGMASSPPARRL